MPTYVVTAIEGRLSSGQKLRMADAITRVYNEVTGEPLFFAQVIVNEVKATNYFVGGVALDRNQIFVQAEIRVSKSSDKKLALLQGLIEAVAESADVPRSEVWAYIRELPAAQMAEFGHVLPESGNEQNWLAALPDSERQRIYAIGRPAR